MELGDQKPKTGRASEVRKEKWELYWWLGLRSRSSYPTEMNPKGKLKVRRGWRTCEMVQTKRKQTESLHHDLGAKRGFGHGDHRAIPVKPPWGCASGTRARTDTTAWTGGAWELG